MNRRISTWLLAASLGTGLCACAATNLTVGKTPKQFRDNQIIITLPKETRDYWPAITQALIEDYGLQASGDFPLDSIGVQCVVFDVPAAWSYADKLKRLDHDPRVEAVQANQQFQSEAQTYTDPYASMQYGARAIRADAAHAFRTGRQVKVAVIDTGVDQDHPDLRGRVTKTENFVEGGERSFGLDRHGTAVAGVIAAQANNGIGIVGVAPDAEIIATKACFYRENGTGKASCSSWTLAKALDFAIKEGAQVINMSLSGPYDPLLARLLVAAAAKGIVTVAAVAGPSAAAMGFPASLPSVIPVIAADAQGKVVAPAWERTRLVAAPGVEVLTTAPPEGYDFLSGSSIAAAQVSGVLALLLESGPGLSAGEVRQVLQETARPVTLSDGGTPKDIGLVDACAALSTRSPAIQCE